MVITGLFCKNNEDIKFSLAYLNPNWKSCSQSKSNRWLVQVGSGYLSSSINVSGTRVLPFFSFRFSHHYDRLDEWMERPCEEFLIIQSKLARGRSTDLLTNHKIYILLSSRMMSSQHKTGCVRVHIQQHHKQTTFLPSFKCYRIPNMRQHHRAFKPWHLPVGSSQPWHPW